MYIAKTAMKYTPSIEVHLSTQASCVNSESAMFYEKQDNYYKQITTVDSLKEIVNKGMTLKIVGIILYQSIRISILRKI